MQLRKTVSSCVVLFLFLLSSSPLFAAEGLIKKVVFHETNGQSESVVFYLDGPWLPKAFALKGENPRVVFDFMETRLARSVPSSIAAKGDMIKKIRIGRHSNKTRVVMDLAPGGTIDFDQKFNEKENILTIQLYPAAVPEKIETIVIKAEQEKVVTPEPLVVPQEEIVVAAAVVEEQKQEAVEVTETVEEVVEVVTAEVAAIEEVIPVVKEETDPALDPLLTEISFENTSSKGEMVLFKLNGFYPPTVTGKEEGTPLVICDFAGTRLGDKVVKELATHGEYVEKVSVKQLKDSDLIRVTLELVPNKSYDLQQVFFKEDSLFVIIINTYNLPEEAKE
jgi:hypothetical protein